MSKEGPETGYMRRLDETMAFLEGQLGEAPEVAVVLGSGASPAAEVWRVDRSIAYSSIPHFPETGVVGHPGALLRVEAGSGWFAALELFRRLRQSPLRSPLSPESSPSALVKPGKHWPS